MIEPIPVALIGFGFAGSTFHAPFIVQTKGLDLRVVSSRDSRKVHEALSPLGVDAEVVSSPHEAAVHKDVKLVVIATPNDSHFPLAKAALENGKNVVVDKPFTLDITESRALAKIAASTGLLLSVFQNRRWDSDFLHLRRALAANTIGPVVEFESHMDRYRPEVRDRWRERSAPGSGVWFDIGPHLADQALLLFGPPSEISASIACTRPGAKTNDWALVTLHYHPNNVRGAMHVVLHTSMLVASPSYRFAVHGLKGSLLKPQKELGDGQSPLDLEYGLISAPLQTFGPDGLVSSEEAFPGTQAEYYAEIRDAISGKGKNPVSPEQAVTLMAVLETAAKSAEIGKRLPLELSDLERHAWGQ